MEDGTNFSRAGKTDKDMAKSNRKQQNMKHVLIDIHLVNKYIHTIQGY